MQSGVMVSALNSALKGTGLRPGQGQCIVFLMPLSIKEGIRWVSSNHQSGQPGKLPAGARMLSVTMLLQDRETSVMFQQ